MSQRAARRSTWKGPRGEFVCIDTKGPCARGRDRAGLLTLSQGGGCHDDAELISAGPRPCREELFALVEHVEVPPLHEKDILELIEQLARRLGRQFEGEGEPNDGGEDPHFPAMYF